MYMPLCAGICRYIRFIYDRNQNRTGGQTVLDKLQSNETQGSNDSINAVGMPDRAILQVLDRGHAYLSPSPHSFSTSAIRLHSTPYMT